MQGLELELDPKKMAKQALILLAEAALFGIGVELGKDLYRLIRRRRARAEEDVISPDAAGLDGGAADAGAESQ